MAKGDKAGSERREVFYRGRVQGVGFRATTRHLAPRFEVTGFVKNLPDGRVQVVAEGPAEELDAFFEQVDASLGSFIRDRNVSRGPATGEFSDFEIRF